MVTRPAFHAVDLDAARRAWLAGAGDDHDGDAALPIVDAHHHFWDWSHNPHPWLQCEPPIAFRYGDYRAIRRDFLPHDYRRATAGHHVVRQVLMEGEWDPADPAGEAAWVQRLAADSGVPQAMAAQVWLDRDDLAGVLAAYREMPLVRSVRHKPRVTTRALHRAGFADAGSMRCPRWRDGFARLAPARLLFELQAPWWHLDEAAELARDFPATTIVLNHAGLPAERDDASLAAWRSAIDRLAEQANVVVKISGIGVPGQRWTADLQRPVVHALLQAFGASRCLFASNYPVDSLVASFDDIVTSLKVLTCHLSPADRLAVFCDNAVRLYRLH